MRGTIIGAPIGYILFIIICAVSSVIIGVFDWIESCSAFRYDFQVLYF